jgi:hypothetical protein
MAATAATQPNSAALHHGIVKPEFCSALFALNNHLPTSVAAAYGKLLSKINFFEKLLRIILDI